MALHPEFPRSPYAPLIPSQRWFPADETLRSTAYEKLLPPLVAKIREEVYAWRQKGDPFGPKPVGRTTDSKTDLGEIIRDVEELAVFNDEAHHIHDKRMAWFKFI